MVSKTGFGPSLAGMVVSLTWVPAGGMAATTPPAFAACKVCHAVSSDARPGMGPNLAGVAGAPAGDRPGYAYSPAMKASKIRWTRANLDAFIADPRAVVPGTRMAFPGIADAARRKAIIDYLVTLK